MRTTVAEIIITRALLERPSPTPDYLREKLALQDIAAQMADNPEELLPHLVRQAMDICDAASAGISVLDGQVFRWIGLAGGLAAFEGGTTPRDFSPCGVCIDKRSAVLMQRPERVYDWIAAANISVPEVLLVPLMARDEPIGTLWVIADQGQHFNAEHERVMTDLATFTGAALRMVQSEGRLKKTLEDQEMLVREISHRIKNLFAVIEAIITMARRSAQTTDEMADALLGRVRALSDAARLVRPSPGTQSLPHQVDLAELITTVLRPFTPPMLSGPDIQVAEHATNGLALILHELATNAAKYGALSAQGGAVGIGWKIEGEHLDLTWHEAGGPAVAAPSSKGFGSILLERTLASYGGTLEHEWSPGGLRVHIKIPLDRVLSRRQVNPT